MSADIAVDDAHPLAGPVATLLTAFLDATDGEPMFALTQAAEMRRNDPNISADEAARIDAAVQLIADLRQPTG